MTNKPKVELTERDLSTKSLDDQMREAWDQMFEGEDRAFTEAMFNALDHCPPYRPGAPVMVLSTPTSPHKSLWHRHFREAFPHLVIADEVHHPYKPLDRSHLHEHQALAMSWLDNHPAMVAHYNANGSISIDTESYTRQGMNLERMPMIVRPRLGFGGHMDRDARDAETIEHLRRMRNNIRPWPEESYFEYPSIGGQFKLFGFDVNLIEDEYVAPPKKKAKDWDDKAQFWYRSAMGSKHNMNLAIAAYRAKNKDIYNPGFDWQNQHEARRNLHHIKHVNVGTVGHVDWGNNRMKRARPYWPGYLAECIRTAIANY